MEKNDLFSFPYATISDSEFMSLLVYDEINPLNYDFNNILLNKHSAQTMEDDTLIGLNNPSPNFKILHSTVYATTEDLSNLCLPPDNLSIVQLNCRSIKKISTL